MNTRAQLSHVGTLILVAAVLVTLGGYGGYVIGRNNADAQALSLNQLSLAPSVHQLITKGQIEKAHRLLDEQIDCGIIAAVRVRKSPCLFPDNRRVLDRSLGRAFAFRETYPYVLINTNNMTPEFKKQFHDALTMTAQRRSPEVDR
ncbi:MAG: hypothetical protein KBC05_16355 [Candidatus Hydrogenedentes bacterium]|nr:hypothetical protein [Candidatus Hydrogenedentota bacterium]